MDYIRASFVQGTVTDSLTGSPLFNVTVEILETFFTTQTAFDGTYSFGSTLSGVYDIQFSKEGYNTEIVYDVEIINGVILDLDVDLSPEVISAVEDLAGGNRFDLYPNPFESKVTLDYSVAEAAPGQLRVQLYNLMAEQVLDLSPGNTEGRMAIGEGLPSGIYFLKVLNGQQVVETKRLIKK